MSEQTTSAVQRLMDQYTEIARLAGALAHEIKNPLSTIRLNLQLLAEDIEDEPSPHQHRSLRRVATMQSECQRLQGLLDDFLNFAKVRKLTLRPTDLNAELGDLLDFFAPEAEAAGVDVVRYFDPELPTVLLDRESFRGAVLNLLLNAKQAMPDGGQLTVATGGDGEWVLLHLIDTGCGMDDQTAARMFETFFSTKPGGSGLGLPTTSKIIEAHGGAIRVETEVDCGTHFTISLPVPPRLAGQGSVEREVVLPK
ncbi:two-component system sensor histidine kinase NtrB [Aeoliella sp.]|uniref:two-component system sensor histidine kinase NtrB n=1 Tax=Aeoliella sp. TaxID=2795800 RepID=UPI003CCBCC19